MKSFISKIGSVAALAVLAGQPLVMQAHASTHLQSKTMRQFSKTDVMQMVVEEALRNGVVPVELAVAVARVESNFNPDAKSHAGAIGVMQIMPATGWGEFGVPEQDLWDADTNIRLGVEYLERLYVQYDENWNAALSHYNGGSLKRDENGDAMVHGYTQDYVNLVNSHWDAYRADTQIAGFVAGQDGEANLIRVAGGPLDLTLLGGAEDGVKLATPSATETDNVETAPKAQTVYPRDDDMRSDKMTNKRVADDRLYIEYEPDLSDNLSVSTAVTGRVQPANLAEDLRSARASFRQALAIYEGAAAY